MRTLLSRPIASLKSKLMVAAALLTAITLTMFSVAGSIPAHAQAQAPTPPAPTPAAPRARGGNGQLAQAGIQFAAALIDATVQTLGINESQVVQALASGKSLKDIITENNGDVAQVKALAKQKLTDAINQSALNANVKARLINSLDALLDRAINGTFQGRGGQNGQLNRALMRLGGATLLVAELSKVTSLTQRDIAQQLRAGKTLAQIATENKADVQAIVSAAVAQATVRINRLVSNGRLSQQQADQLIATLPTELTKLMNQVNPLRGGGGSTVPGAPPASTPPAPATPSL